MEETEEKKTDGQEPGEGNGGQVSGKGNGCDREAEEMERRLQRWADKRQFAGERVASMKRRSIRHDYHSQRFYMVTLVVQGRYAVLGRLVGDADAAQDSLEEPRVERTPLGEAVASQWAGIPGYYPEVAVIAQCVMPDHFHGILYVREHTGFHLGQVIKGFKLGCNRELRRLTEEGRARQAAMESQHTREGAADCERAGGCGVANCERAGGCGVAGNGVEDLGAEGRSEAAEQEDGSFWRILRLYAANSLQPAGKETLWEANYNDRILHNYSTLQKWKDYLHDNPRRLAIRRAHPDYFRVQFHVNVAGRDYAAIGNRFLLHYPERMRVQLTRSLTAEQIQEEVDGFYAKARGGTVLVSPAISEGEAAVMRRVLDAGLPLIFLTPWGFNTFSKPGHQYYEACAEGRFLILAPWPHQNVRIPLTRAMCLALNEMAREIAECEGLVGLR